MTFKKIYSSLPEPRESVHQALASSTSPPYLSIKFNLTECLDFFIAHDALSQINQTEVMFPSSMAEFENIYSDGSRCADHLQRLISRGMASHAFATLTSKYPTNTPERARLQSLNQEYANYWLTVHGTHPSLRLSDPDFRVSLCYRLGLLPFFFPDLTQLKCHDQCQVDLLKNPYHRFHCNRENKRGRYHQHNNIQAQLVSFARSFGLSAQQTPGNFRLDDKRTLDASITMDDYIMLVDVTGIDNLAPSHIARNSSGADKAASDRSQKKLSKYGDFEQAMDVRIVPFIYDLLGGLQPSAVDTLKEIAKCGEEDSNHRSRLHRVRRCISRMSVAIQKDNATMLRSAFLSSKHK